jgi:hypothetical protein
VSKDTIIRLPNGDAVSARSIVQVRSFNIDDDWYVSCTSSSGPPVSINYCCERDAVTARDKLIRRWEEALADDEPRRGPDPTLEGDGTPISTYDNYVIITDPFMNKIRTLVGPVSLQLTPADARDLGYRLISAADDLRSRHSS